MRFEHHDEPGAEEPRRLADSLAEVASELHLDDPRVTAEVFSRWGALVGETVSAHTRPRVLRQGVLTVEVDSPAWATQLRYLEQQIVERFDGVRGLRIVVGRR
jgi:predicted nucleic acid-binding Zn ribbon protein